MRLAIFSDSHGQADKLYTAIETLSRMGPIDDFIFLGDGAYDFDHCRSLMGRLNPQAVLYTLRGNNDFSRADLPTELVIEKAGVTLMLTHGHSYHVKATRQWLQHAAHKLRCRAALYGHTHVAHVEDLGGVLLLNPGAIGDSYRDASAAILDIGPQGALQPRLINL